MNTQIIIVCDTEAERDFARQLCTQRGYRVVNVAQPQHIQVMEVDGNAPNYALTGKYARMGAGLWVVTAEK